MVLHRVLVTDPAAFDAAVAAAKASTPDATFVLLTGAPADGGGGGPSWCPDCNVAKPVLEPALAAAGAAGAVTLVECSIPRAGYAGVPTHPYRVHPGIKLRGVPTLLKWGAGRKTGELVEAQCADEALVRELVLGE